MNNKKTATRIKIGIGMIVSFIAVTGLSPVVFIANTPQLNPNVAYDLITLPINTVARLTGTTAEDKLYEEETQEVIQTAQQPPDGLNYTPISRNVQAAEDPQTGTQYVQIESGTKLQVNEIQLNDGRIVKVYTAVDE